MTLLAYFVVTLAIGFSVGWFLACAFVTTGLRKDIARLDAERADLDRGRAQLDKDRRQAVEYAEHLLRATPTTHVMREDRRHWC